MPAEILIKRKMKMHKDTYLALKTAGFKIIPVEPDIRFVDNGILWNWGWYGGDLDVLGEGWVLNDPRYIRETTVLGCFEKYVEYMPRTATSKQELDVNRDGYIICKNNGFKGHGKLVCRWADAPYGFDIYQEFLGEDREEYRAIMVGDKRIVSYRKLLEDKLNPQTEKIYKMCGGQRSGEEPFPEALRKLARKVMRRSALDILGLDLMLMGDGRALLTELNSAPGIGEYSARKLWEFLQMKNEDEGF